MNNQQEFAISLSQMLKRAEVKFRKERGLNPSFPWSTWGDRPRACALWTELELQALQAYLVEKREIGVDELCELAWIHGRSANGVLEKVTQRYGWRVLKGMKMV